VHRWIEAEYHSTAAVYAAGSEQQWVVGTLGRRQPWSLARPASFENQETRVFVVARAFCRESLDLGAVGSSPVIHLHWEGGAEQISSVDLWSLWIADSVSTSEAEVE
jgi:hypothetical protein